MDVIVPDSSHGKTIQKPIDMNMEIPAFKDKKVQPVVPKLSDFFQPMTSVPLDWMSPLGSKTASTIASIGGNALYQSMSPEMNNFA